MYRRRVCRRWVCRRWVCGWRGRSRLPCLWTPLSRPTEFFEVRVTPKARILTIPYRPRRILGSAIFLQDIFLNGMAEWLFFFYACVRLFVLVFVLFGRGDASIRSILPTLPWSF